MKTKLPELIETEEQAKQFLASLLENDECYHPEDDANDVVWNLPEDQKPTPDECAKLNILMNMIYDLDSFDPCEYILNQDEEYRQSINKK